METLTEEPTTEATERLLIFQQESEINRITNEIQERARMLNAIATHELSPDEIKNATSSKFSIDQFVENQQLKTNKDYARMKKAGIQVTATLTDELQNLKDALLRWESLKGNKYSGLIVEGNTWKVDKDWLEREFEMKGQKIYVSGEQLEKYRKAEQLITLLESFKIEWNHIANAPSLSKLIVATGHGFSVNWRYFRER